MTSGSFSTKLPSSSGFINATKPVSLAAIITMVRIATASATETDTAPNPFLDYRLTVILEGPSGQQLVVPGFFDGDGEDEPNEEDVEPPSTETRDNG